jgi:hypothetical protein
MTDFTRTLDMEKKYKDWLKHCRICPGNYYCKDKNVKECITLDNPDVKIKN